MDPEKQKQILGYFIEEASDHLNTLESSLVNLQETLADPEMMNEVFRAAHSIKGGAAMLGITGMQHVSHNLEDSFKVLKDYPDSKVDRDLQSMLLAGVDTLKELLQQLQNPSELDEQITQEALANAEPLFAQLKTRISALIPASIASDKPTEELRAMIVIFRSDVPVKLRSMLQLFKQPDRPTSRHQLQIICDQLYQMGEQFYLEEWCDLVQIVKQVFVNPNITYRILAPIVIREIKQAQEAVLSQQPIVVSSQLKALMPLPDRAATVDSDDDISHIFGDFISETKATETRIPVTNLLEGKILDDNLQRFGSRLQWRVNGAWIGTANINFSESAPAGHLPAPIWLTGWGQHDRDSELGDRIQKFMTKIDDCVN